MESPNLKKKILLMGARGQLGTDLARLIQSENKLFDYTGIDIDDLDICNPSDVKALLMKLEKQDVIINCIAYTNTVQAEIEKELAMNVNANALLLFLDYCKNHNTLFIQLSTDFVFDGEKKSPYTETDRPSPLNVYGKSKLEAENMITKKLEKYFIFRTSSLFGVSGAKGKGGNFIETMIQRARSESLLNIISEGAMSPTYAPDLAATILYFIKNAVTEYGLYHATNSGSCSWYEFSEYFLAKVGLTCPIQKVSAGHFPSSIRRPVYSVLSNEKINSYVCRPSWQAATDQYLKSKGYL